jgi:ribosomal-protein-alanine N-acetyltransferase
MGAEVKRAGSGAVIRAMRAEDATAVARVLGQAPEAANWSEQSLREAAAAPGVALVSENDAMITGFLLGRQVGDEAEILNLAVLPERRHRGEGGALLEKALEEFRMRGVGRVFLEVRESNETAIGFYGKQGFAKMGRRPGYYLEPEEAALLMGREVDDPA